MPASSDRQSPSGIVAVLPVTTNTSALWRGDRWKFRDLPEPKTIRPALENSKRVTMLRRPYTLAYQVRVRGSAIILAAASVHFA